MGSSDAYQACLGLALGLGLGLGLGFGLDPVLLLISVLGLAFGRRGVWAFGFLGTEKPAVSSSPRSASSM